MGVMILTNPRWARYRERGSTHAIFYSWVSNPWPTYRHQHNTWSCTVQSDARLLRFLRTKLLSKQKKNRKNTKRERERKYKSERIYRRAGNKLLATGSRSEGHQVGTLVRRGATLLRLGGQRAVEGRREERGERRGPLLLRGVPNAA
jgi:hypothetical protein